MEVLYSKNDRCFDSFITTYATFQQSGRTAEKEERKKGKGRNGASLTTKNTKETRSALLKFLLVPS